eukprot:TRINITY_DN687_c0_g2_i9.p1 TRINITY_DN687_c0_g2~~TRINITY_DN687_c0_g2_i9.p1  ORF type:complete len:185 (+),score=43.15 TRINITY_DN687_c0_g2_i9:237-791(+)
MLAVATILVYIQPEMNVSTVTLSVFDSLTGSGGSTLGAAFSSSSTPVWVTWILIVEILLIFSAVTSLLPLATNKVVRLAFALSVGVLAGLYICGVYLPPYPLLYMLMCGIVTCPVVFVVFTQWPTAGSGKVMPWVYALFLALLPTTVFTLSRVFALTTGFKIREHLRATIIILLALYTIHSMRE